MLADRRVVVTGGTGSLGKALVRRLARGAELGRPREVVVFSRDEAKQHAMRLEMMRRSVATDAVVWDEDPAPVRFVIGDVADYSDVCRVLRGADVVINAAGLKQVPTCEHFPAQAVKTNVLGVENIIRAVRDLGLQPEVVVGVATDKACKPVNVMGMTKALGERMLAQANLECPATRFVVARYGNVLASRGSVIPLFHEQVRDGGPVTVTSEDMTRFLMTIDEAVDTVLTAVREALPGETLVRRAPAARVIDVARALIAESDIALDIIGIRPGEKLHEVLISEEEMPRTVARGMHFAIAPILPELRRPRDDPPAGLGRPEYSSADDPIDAIGVRELLTAQHLTLQDAPVFS